MRTGACQVCITPRGRTDLTGYIAREQPAVGILDDLYVRALFLDDECGERVLWLLADLLALPRDRVVRWRRGIATALGFEERQVLCSATHTHAGPPTLLLRNCGTVNVAYLEMLDERMRQAAEGAVAAAEPVTLRFMESRCTINRDRRMPSPLSHTDERVPVLALQRFDGTYVAVLANYPVHNVGLNAGNRCVSADISGAAAEHVRVRLPGNPVTLVTNGACGNLNPNGKAGTPEAMTAQGVELGETIIRAASKAGTRQDPRLGASLQPVELPLAVLSPGEIEAEYVRATAAIQDTWPFAPAIRAAYAAWRCDAMAASGREQSVTVDLQVVQVGPAVFAGMGAEVFSRMGDDLRRACGAHAYVVGYANGDIGYLPFREVYAEGGYEVHDACKFYGRFMVAPGGYENLRDKAIAAIRTCRRSDG